MKKDDIPLATFADLPAALGLLSRVPVRVDMAAASARGARAAWAYPLAGAVLGALAAAVVTAALFIGMSGGVAAGLALITLAVVTGAMHEDGLADSIDGLWGGWNRVRRLEIMKDSRTGAYGVIALVLSLGLRWVALSEIIDANLHWPVLIAVAASSRAAMVPVMTALPHARADGLSRHVGRPPPQIAWMAIACAFVICLLALGLSTVMVLVVAGTVTTLWAATAHRKIGGQTGDILGATQQLVEIALLLACTLI